MHHRFGAHIVTILFVMKIAKREVRSQSTDIVSNPMNQHERQGKIVFEFPRNCIHHPGRVCDCIEPEAARHFFLVEYAQAI